jgi:anti-sigma-K factor RskA
VAEINKLSVGGAIDKLRRADVQSSQVRLDEKMDALDEDIRRMRATRRRLENDQQAAKLAAGNAQGSASSSNKKGAPFWAFLAIVVAILAILIILYATLPQ